MRRLIIAAFAAALLVPAIPAGAQPTIDGASPHRDRPDGPGVSVSDASTVEGAGDLEFTLSLAEASEYPVGVLVRTEDGTAKEKSDYARVMRRVVIPAGETDAIVTVPVVDDGRAERDEVMGLRILRVRNGQVDDGHGFGVIYDNEDRVGKPVFDLNILHINDHHSHLEADDIDIFIGEEEFEIEMGGFPRVVQAYHEIAEHLGPDANVAKIHAGDAITGTLFYTLFAGEADAVLMNEICFDIFELGNHEFDASDEGLKVFLDFLAVGDCGTEVLAANVIPAVGTPLAPVTTTDYFKPFTVLEYDGHEVGFVGLDIAQKTQVSSQPLDTTQFLDEVTTAQLYVDLLTASGIDKIVLVTHYGYDNDLALALDVAGVDVIVGGDSHTLLGDFDAAGLTSLGDYPTWTTDAAGNPVCVVQAWQFSNVVGELHVGWDKGGQVATCAGTPHLMLGEVTEFDEDGNGVLLTQADVDAFLAGQPNLRQWGVAASAQALLDTFAAEVDVLAEEVIGVATEDICLARFPNDGRSTLCAVGTLDQGGEIQQLVTQAFLARAFRADVALQNSGGVRIDIPAGDVTIGDAYTLLPFANTLVELDMTGAEIALALEQGLSNVLDAGGSTGAFPYGAGIRWDLDTTQPFGERFTNIEIRRKGETEWLALDDAATYVVVANSFMAGGGDGYFVLEDVVNDGRSVDTGLDYAQSFIDYVEQDSAGEISKPTEYSLQSYIE